MTDFTLPPDILNLIDQTDQTLEKIEHQGFEQLERLGRKYDIEIERLEQPICNCNGTNHVMKSIDLDSDDASVDSWLQDKASPIRVYRIHLSIDKSRRSYRVCERVRAAHPLVILARQA